MYIEQNKTLNEINAYFKDNFNNMNLDSDQIQTVNFNNY